jgi:hypothetical protein
MPPDLSLDFDGELLGKSVGICPVFVKRKGQHFLKKKDSTNWFQIVH